MQLPREVSKRYFGFTPLNPGAMFLLVPSDFLSAFATYHVAFRGNIYAPRNYLVAMRVRDNDAKRLACLVLAGFTLISLARLQKIRLQDYSII
jgi:hypothetical protein